MKFIDYADRNRILLAVLPPHSTHRLQPLDIGIFSPLSKAYSNEVDKLIRSGWGYLNVTKRDFWKLFYKAWCTALTAANIKAGFEATGIYPLQPQRQLQIFDNRPITPPISTNEPATPLTARGLRRITKKVHLRHSLADRGSLLKIMRATEQLAFKNDLLRHENDALRGALITEKQRRKRGKGMGLFDREKAGQAQFFSPTKVEQARQRLIDNENEKSNKLAQAEAAKLQRAIQKDEQAREAAERKAARQEAQKQRQIERAAQREQAALERKRKAGEQAAQRMAKKARNAQSNAQSPVKPPQLGKKKASPKKARPASPAPVIPAYLSQARATRSGRNIKLNTRLFS